MHSILSTLSCLSLSCRTLSYPSELFLQYPCSYIFCSNQMVNTRRGSDQQQGQNNQGQNNQGTGIPMPPPLTPEQYFSSRCRWWPPWTILFRHFSRLTRNLRLLHHRRLATGVQSFWGVTRRCSPIHLTHSRQMTVSVQWSDSWTSPSAMIGSVSCTQQDSCVGQLWTGGSPTQFRTARLSPGSSSGSSSAATTSPWALWRWSRRSSLHWSR